MNGEEPYRWLEAIQNRREYIEDQMQAGNPVVAIHGEAGVLLMTPHASTPKLFEVYDHLALGCLGHPADLEKLRQAAIDAAHMEGFARSKNDVNSRRLVNYNLGPLLKTAFEQIFSAPFMFRGLLAEVEPKIEEDIVWIIDYDGSYHAAHTTTLAQGVLISGRRSTQQTWEALKDKAAPQRGGLKGMAHSALSLLHWAFEIEKKDHKLDRPESSKSAIELLKDFPEGLECALLDRTLVNQTISYRVPTLSELGLDG